MARSSFGQVRKLPSGRYQARYWQPGTTRAINAPTTFTSKVDARGWLATVQADVVRGVWSPPKPVMTFGEYAERWLAERTLKPRTRHDYRMMLDKFLLPEFEQTPLREITPDVVRAWHARLVTGPTYKAHAYSLLRTITRAAVDDRLIEYCPCVVRGAGRVERAVTIKPATLDELTALALAMPEAYRLMIPLASWCALRYGELAELRRSDIDLKDGVIRIRRGVTFVRGEAIVSTPKSVAGVRDVHVPPHLLPMIKAHLRDHVLWGKDALLFPGPTGEHLTTATFYEAWRPARVAAGCPIMRFHDLRHSGAVLAAQTGATLAELMARLGHSTPAAAMRYQHAAKGRDAEIAALLSKIAEASAH